MFQVDWGECYMSISSPRFSASASRLPRPAFPEGIRRQRIARGRRSDGHVAEMASAALVDDDVDPLAGVHARAFPS
jgi:hypothetical protein